MSYLHFLFYFLPSPPFLLPIKLGQLPPLGIITGLIMCCDCRNNVTFKRVHLKAMTEINVSHIFSVRL